MHGLYLDMQRDAIPYFTEWTSRNLNKGVD